MRIIFIACFGVVSLLSTVVCSDPPVVSSRCFDLSHTDGVTRDICEKNGKSFLILEFFKPGCGACQRNVAPFKKLERETSNWAHSRLISLDSLNATTSFIHRHQIDTEVALDLNAEVRRSYGIQGVPTVVVLDSDNHVIHRSVGVLNDLKIQEIKNLVSR